MIKMQELRNGYVIEMTDKNFKFNCPYCHHGKCYTLFVDKVVCEKCKSIVDIEDNVTEEIQGRYRSPRPKQGRSRPKIPRGGFKK
jgi:Fe2+ or Zn2+ uptake regulation protein